MSRCFSSRLAGSSGCNGTVLGHGMSGQSFARLRMFRGIFGLTLRQLWGCLRGCVEPYWRRLGFTRWPLKRCPARPAGYLRGLQAGKPGGARSNIDLPGTSLREAPRGARQRRELRAWHHPCIRRHSAGPPRAQESGDSCTPISAQCVHWANTWVWLYNSQNSPR